MGIDILGVDILGIDILGIDILAPTQLSFDYREAITIYLLQHFEADSLWKVPPPPLNPDTCIRNNPETFTLAFLTNSL